VYLEKTVDWTLIPWTSSCPTSWHRWPSTALAPCASSRPTRASSSPSPSASRPTSCVRLSFYVSSALTSASQISEYIVTLLTGARALSNEAFLKASAATFREAWRLVDASLQVAAARPDAGVSRTQAEDVV
jgi:hypothetical protein